MSTLKDTGPPYHTNSGIQNNSMLSPSFISEGFNNSHECLLSRILLIRIIELFFPIFSLSVITSSMALCSDIECPFLV